MTKDTYTGGPAFPTLGRELTDMTGAVVTSGMSLRDWFAACSLPEAVGRAGKWTHAEVEQEFGKSGPPVRHEQIAAVQAYRYADALLKARGE